MVVQVYEPLPWQHRIGYRRTEKRCSAAVYNSIPGPHQCGRKPVETIDGYGWCRQHAEGYRRQKEANKP